MIIYYINDKDSLYILSKITLLNSTKEDKIMCKTTTEDKKKYNGCNKRELVSVLGDNNISYDEISEYIGFDFNNLIEEVYSLPKIIITKLNEYLLSKGVDTTGVFYYETPNEDGCTDKEKYTDAKFSSLIALSNLKSNLRNNWKLGTLSIFFSEKIDGRLQNILSGRTKWSTYEEYDNLNFFKNGKGKYYPSSNERYLINVDLFNNVTNDQQELFCKAVGIPSFILDKILYEDMPLNLTACDLLLNKYNELFSTSYRLKEFCKEKDTTTVDAKKKRKAPKPFKKNFSVSNIPQEIINGFTKILDQSLTVNRLSVITGVPYNTTSRMIQKMKDHKDYYLSLVDNTPIDSIAPIISDSSEIIEKAEHNDTQPIIYDEDMFKEVKTPSHKSLSSEVDLEMFSRFTPEYLRSVSEYLNILADLKDAENRSKAIQNKLS